MNTTTVRSVGRVSQFSCRPSVLWSGNVVFSREIGGHQKGSVTINKEGIIERCLPGHCRKEAREWAYRIQYDFIDLGETAALSPGLIDVHAHISELGRDWEGYETATRAGAAGGITTLMGMPLNSLPPTTTSKRFNLEKEASLKVPLLADVGLWGGVVPSNANPTDLGSLLDSGVFGIKAFLSPLPKAAGFEAVSPKQLSIAAEICGKRGKPILVHSELMSEKELQHQAHVSFRNASKRSYKAHVLSRPPEWERDAVDVVCGVADRCNMHIVHLSDSECIPIISAAKDEGRSLTVETCPHYLIFDSNSVSDGETKLKCFPPIRDAPNREALWELGMRTGVIDMIASDHSPCSPDLRFLTRGDMKQAWGGLSGLQYQLPATYTEATKRGLASLSMMARWWSENPSSLIPGMESIKGSILEGKQADLVWWDPDYFGVPNSYGKEHHRWQGSYFADMPLRGRVLGTWLRGEKVFDGETDKHLEPVGRFLLSAPA